MRTNNRKLTSEEQAILQYVMYKKKINQLMIAQKNNTTHTTISRLVRGQMNITPQYINMFFNCDIDLEEIMNYKKKYRKDTYRTRTKFDSVYLNAEQCWRLKLLLQEKNISQRQIARTASTSKSIIWRICKGKYKVSPLMKQHFLKSGIDLNEIMEGK